MVGCLFDELMDDILMIEVSFFIVHIFKAFNNMTFQLTKLQLCEIKHWFCKMIQVSLFAALMIKYYHH